MPEETPNPIPQEAPKLPGGPQGTVPPVGPQGAPVSELSPVQQAIVTQAQAPITGEAMGGALKGTVTGLVGEAVDTKLAQIGSTIFEFGRDANAFTKEASRQTAAGILAGVEGTGRAGANLLPERWFETFGVTDDQGNPISNFSTDPKDFVYAPNGAWGEFLSDITTQAIMSLAIAQTGVGALGMMGPRVAGLKKAFDFAGNKTKLGKIAAFMNVNGVENLAQRLWETRSEGVQDVRWWAKTLGIEEMLPEVLASGKDLSTLEQAASDYLGGATGGALAGGTLMAIAKIGLGIIGKGVDSAFDHYGGPPRGTPERERLALAYANTDYDARLRDGVEDVLNDPLSMQSAPPPREVTGADVIEGTAPPAPETVPIFRVSTVDESAATAAKQRLAELLPQNRGAVEELGTLAERRQASTGTIVETKEGKLLSQEALDLPIAQRKQALIDGVSERIRLLDDPKSGFDPATRQLIYQDVLTAFSYEWTQMVDQQLPRIIEDAFTKKDLANDLLRSLGEMGFPKQATRLGAADEEVFGAIAVHAMIKTFNKIWNAADLKKQEQMMKWIADTRAIRFGVERNPTAALSNLTRQATAAAPHDVTDYAPIAGQALTEMVVMRDSLLQIVRTIHSIAPDGNINHLSADQRAEVVGAILQSFKKSLDLRRAIRTGALATDGSVDQVVTEAMLARSQSTPPTQRAILEGSKEVPVRKKYQLSKAMDLSPDERAALEAATAGGGQTIPSEMPSAAAREVELSPREILDIQPDTIVMSGDVDVPTAAGGLGPRTGPYNVGIDVNGAATLLSELSSQKETLAQDMLALIRAGVLDAGETKAVLNQIRNTDPTLNPAVVEFLQTLFKDEQTARLESLVLLTDIFRAKGGGSKNVNIFDPGFLSDMPTPQEIATAARNNAQARIAQNRYRTTPEERAPWSDEQVLQRETELDLIAIERELMNMAEGDVRTNQVASDLAIAPAKNRWERGLDRALTAHSKAYLTYSAGNVLSANTIQYLAEAVAASMHSAIRIFDSSPEQLAALFRTKLMWKNLLVHNVKSLARDRKALTEVARTGRSTLFGEQNTAKEMLSKVQSARGQILFEDPSLLDNPNIGLEGVGVTAPARLVPMADELFRLRINETEFKTKQVFQYLKTNNSTDLDAASKYADALWDKKANEIFDKTEAGMLKAAAAKVDAMGMFRDASGRIKDPITYSAMVMRQYWDDIGSTMRMVDPAQRGVASVDVEGLDAIVAPDMIKNFNDDISPYIAHMASASTLEGFPGALVEAMGGKALPTPLRIFLAPNIFPQTRVNEAVKMIDYMGAAPGWTFQSLSNAIRRPNAAERASAKKMARKSFFYTMKEMASPDPIARKRAEARVMFSALLYGAFTAWWFKRNKDEPAQLTVESATEVSVSPPVEGQEPTVTKAALPMLREQGSKTAEKARRILGQKRGEIGGMEVPILTGAINIFDLVMGSAEKGGKAIAKGVGYEGTKRILETMEQGIALSAENPEDIDAILLDVADVLGASDFVDTVKDTMKGAGNVFSDMVSKILTVPLGGFSLYGTLAEMQSGYKLESRVATPFGEGLIPVWRGAEGMGTNILRFVGRKGREQRENVTGAKKKLPEAFESRILPKILGKALGISTDYELDLGDGTSRPANKSLARLLAAKGYPIPYIDKKMRDFDPTRRRGEIDLSTYTMGDNRDAHTHLLDLFMYGDPNLEFDDPNTAKNPLGGIGGGKDYNQTLIQYLNFRLAPQGVFGKPPVGSAASPIPTRVLNQRSAEADLYASNLQTAIEDRLRAAKAALLKRSDEDKRSGRTPKSLREDWLDLATGGIK